MIIVDYDKVTFPLKLLTMSVVICII